VKRFAVAFLVLFLAAALQPLSLLGNEFTEQEAKIMRYKQWLDTVGPQGSRYWIRLDARHRPHRLYVGEGFYHVDSKSQERFLDIFSNYLAGQPDKFVLIYLFDANTNKRVGEYGFDGFKLYSTPMRTAQAPQKTA
jgi:hypothetical protein